MLASLATVMVALLIVSLMDLALMGQITADYLLTGLVTAGIVAPISLWLTSALLREIARQHQHSLTRSVESAETRLRVALDSADEGILMVAADGTVLSANKRFVELWRVPEALAAAGQDALLLNHVRTQLADPEAFVTGVQRLYSGKAQANDTLEFKDGRVFERYTRALDQGAEQGRIWCFRDVTDQARARQALAEREEQFRAIVTQAGEGIDLVDVEALCFVEVNEAACRMLGYRRDELIGQPLATILPLHDDTHLRESVAAAVRKGQVSSESRYRCKDGRLIEVAISVRATRLRGRSCLVGVWRDVTESKRLTETLRVREQYQRALLDNFPFMVWLKDEQGRFLAVNEAFARVFGQPSADALIGKSDLDIAPPDLARQYRADDQAVLHSGRSKQVEELVLTKGRRTWFETFKSPVSVDGHILGTVGFGRDITVRKEAEWHLKMAVEVAQVVFWKIDLPSQTLSFDTAGLELLGLEPDASLTTLPRWLERVHPDEVGPFMARFTAALQPGAPMFDLEYRMRRQDGSHQWIQTKGGLIERGVDGRPEVAVGASMNITERKRAEAELAQHRQHLEALVQQRTTELLATEARASRVLDSAADGLYGVDADGRITFINQSACRMLGHTTDQALGRRAHELFHHSRPDGSPYPAANCTVRQACRTGQEARIDDETYWHADGHAVPVALASHPIVEQGAVVGAVVSVVDVSAQRAATAARERALVAAENLARARSEFLANMSHEIRTPMNGVLGFAQIGLRNHQDPAWARNAFEKIIGSGNQLLGVVNEILDFSKIDAGELRIEATEMSLDDALDGALQFVADRARAKGIDLRLAKAADLPPRCICDPLRLGQVLLNLLTNAVKFTEAGSVTLSARRQGAQLVFSVADTGIGMSADELGFVFNPFQQADGSTTRRFGGTGLGLAICKRLLELMQGEIHVESTPGKGSLFEVRLPYVPPRAQAAEPSAPPEALPEKALAGLTLLVAEDDEINRMVLELNLTEDGARLVMVGDGASAVDRVRADGPTAYDLVLMDIQMPVMDGYEATRRILALAPSLPIIGQTAHAFNEDRDRCLAAGMAGYIAKPIDPQALTRLVLQVLKSRRKPD